MIEWFLDHNADPNRRCDWDLTPTSQAMYKAPLEIIDYLFSRGADAGCGQLLQHAVHRDKSDALDVVRRVVERGAPINEIKYENEPMLYSERKPFGLGTPLHRAAELGKIDIVRYLLEQGANPLKVDSKGKTPRFWAESKNYVEVATVLKERENVQAAF
jgi:ankyrin repeat protein